MPTVSAEAIARKAQRKNERKRAKRAADLAGPAPLVTSMNRKWRIGPKMPEMSKAELRAMFAEAMQRTAEL
jgi:hypothetical protein